MTPKTLMVAAILHSSYFVFPEFNFRILEHSEISDIGIAVEVTPVGTQFHRSFCVLFSEFKKQPAVIFDEIEETIYRLTDFMKRAGV